MNNYCKRCHHADSMHVGLVGECTMVEPEYPRKFCVCSRFEKV